MAGDVDDGALDAAVAALSWEPPDPGEWERDASHQSEPASMTQQEIFPAPFKAGFQHAFGLYGLPLSHMEVRYVNGWSYMSPFVHGAPRKGNGKPPPAIVLKLLTRLPPSARRRIKAAQAAIENDVAMSEIERWNRMRPAWIERNLEFQDVDLAAASDAELADQVRFTAARLAEGFRLHFELISQALPAGEYLARTGEWGLDPKVAGKAAFHGVRSSVEGRQRLDAIAAALGDAVVHDVDQIRIHSAAAAAALDDYLRHHGSWILSDDVQSETLAELPTLVLQTIERHRAGLSDERADIAAAVESCRATVPPGELAEFDSLLSRAQLAYAALDDNSGLLASWSGGLVRRTQVEAGRRLVDRGVLAAPDDIWVLGPAEIAGLLVDSATLTADQIADRVVIRAAQASVSPPDHLGSPPSPPPDPDVFPAPVGQHVRHVGAFMAAKFGDGSTEAFGVGDALATGRAIVATSPSDALERIEPGDVLITTYTTPAFNMVMPILGGVVTIAGGPNSHTAIVARELGIPAVIGVVDALDRIPDGAMATVDPVEATVTVVGDK
jgi:pyruvate,water dikinase